MTRVRKVEEVPKWVDDWIAAIPIQVPSTHVAENDRKNIDEYTLHQFSQ